MMWVASTGAVLSVVMGAGALTVASRIVGVELRFVHALIVVGLSQAGMALAQGDAPKPTLAAMIVNLILYFGGLKIFTGESIWSLIKLSIFAVILSYAAVTAFARIF